MKIKLEPIVYPGHALVVAMYIMRSFKNASSALASIPDLHFPECVGSSEVHGAGDGAYAGAKVIRQLQQDHSKAGILQSILWSQEEWCRRVGPKTGNHEDHFEPGKEQAERLENLFRTMVYQWDWT